MIEGPDPCGRSTVISKECSYKCGVPPRLRGSGDHGIPARYGRFILRVCASGSGGGIISTFSVRLVLGHDGMPGPLTRTRDKSVKQLEKRNAADTLEGGVASSSQRHAISA